MISVVLTAWSEPETAATAARTLVHQLNLLTEDSEFISVCPDEETQLAVRTVVKEESYGHGIFLKDPKKGKPYALNMAFKKAKGSIMVSTDGDVCVADNAIEIILQAFDDDQVGGVGGRPVCVNDKSTMWGYWGHMFMDAAHAKRLATSKDDDFYPMSGYLLAFRRRRIEIPAGALDDVFISSVIHEHNKKVKYEPNACVYVRQPDNLRDWLRQKVRSIAGFQKLGQYVKRPVITRSVWGDLEYALFPLKYAQNPRELLWSVLQYPVRLYTWMVVWWNLHVLHRSAADLWKRIPSTK